MPLSCSEMVKEAIQKWLEAHRSKGLISEELYKLMQENIDKVVSDKIALTALALYVFYLLLYCAQCSLLFYLYYYPHYSYKLHEMVDPLSSKKLIETVLVCVEPATVFNVVEHITNALRSEHAGETPYLFHNNSVKRDGSTRFFFSTPFHKFVENTK
ncbi:MAG: hypothetical protein QXQ90_09040 [Desulfurococcaceae archaeon]